MLFEVFAEERLGREIEVVGDLLNTHAGVFEQRLGFQNHRFVDPPRRRLAAQQSSLGKSTSSLNSQMTATEIQRREVIDQLRKCHVVSPISGTVLEKYAEQGEYATMGKPLFKIADVVDMKLRAYVTASQLNSIKIGQKVRVYADEGEDKRREYQGVITWISDKAEFTPKTIQTRDERSNLVYAVKISVRNTDGLIKIGMYGDVRF